jgi:putative endonuclease
MKARTDVATGQGAERWLVYIIASSTGALYTGITTDLSRRMREHRESRRGARFFRFATAARLLYSERHGSRASATRREAAIKRMSRSAKLALIAAGSAAP